MKNDVNKLRCIFNSTQGQNSIAINGQHYARLVELS